MLRHFRIRKWLTITTVISHRQGEEVIPDNATDIQIVMQTFQRFIVKKFMFSVSHLGYQVSSVYPLSSGRQTRHQEVTLEMPVNLIL